MPILDRLKNSLIRAPVKASGREAFSMDELELLATDKRRIGSRPALYASSYYSCMRIRCDALAKLPVKVMQQNDDGILKLRNHPLWELLTLRPNPWMSAHDFLWATEYQRLDTGNAYWVMETKGGQVKRLHLLDSSRVTIYIDDTKALSDAGRVFYGYADPKKGPLFYTADSIVHFRNFAVDGVQGESIRKYLADLIVNETAATRMLSEKYEKGLQDPIVVQYIGDLDPKKQASIRRKFEALGGAKQAGQVIPIPTEFQVSQLETKLVNAQFFELQGLSVQRIANAFGVKSFQLNDMNKATYNNIAEQNRAFYSETLQNVVTSYEQEMDWVLLREDERRRGVYLQFNVDAILRSDPEKRMQSYVLAVANGIRTRAEIREMEGLPFIEGTQNLSIDNGAGIWLKDLGKQYQTAKEGGEKDEESKVVPVGAEQ